MGAIEDAVDAAAHFIGPFVDTTRKDSVNDFHSSNFADEALSHLQAINAADLAADPNTPYDASLAGVVYGLLDLVSLLAIIAQVSSGVTFSQRPKSVLNGRIILPSEKDERLLARSTQALVKILEQGESGIQPLVLQRTFPDIVSALAELSLSPTSRPETQQEFTPIFQNIITETPTPRLLLILTTFLQQEMPEWLKSVLSRERDLIPLRPQGIRHTVEFLSLAHISKNSKIPQNASDSQSQIPIPLEAIAEASRLLKAAPNGYSQDTWIRALAPQLLALLDGTEGRELSVAAGQIIAGGFLNHRTTGAPGTAGWELFVLPLLQTIHPKGITLNPGQSSNDQVIVQDSDLKVALKRLVAIFSSSPPGPVVRRLTGPLSLSLWALLNHAKARPSLDREWIVLPKFLLLQYIRFARDTPKIDILATHLFWSGETSWTFGPGSQGGVEIRRRSGSEDSVMMLNNTMSQLENMDARINLFASLLEEADISDDMAGSVLINTMKRWLLPPQDHKNSLTNDSEVDPLAAYKTAKLASALAMKFSKQFSRSPQHVIEFMDQLVQNFVRGHKRRVEEEKKSKLPSRATLRQPIIEQDNETSMEEDEVEGNIVTFAMSIIYTLVSSANFVKTTETTAQLQTILPDLTYLSKRHKQLPVHILTVDAARNLIDLIEPAASTASVSSSTPDPLAEHRETLKSALDGLTDPEPPNRTWALNATRKIVQHPTAFSLIDFPSLTTLVLACSLADPESYVHTAAMPVLVDMAVRAPNPVVGILTDAFLDIDETSLKLTKTGQTAEERQELADILDYRLRVGEVLNRVILDESFWIWSPSIALQYRVLKQILDICLNLASRRGQRTKTSATRTRLADAERKVQEEGEAAWGGPMPNLLEPESGNPIEAVEYEALLKIIEGWEDNGVEEDVRIRASALSVLSTIFEHRLDYMRPVPVDGALQIVLLVLTLERTESKAMLRRAGVMVILGFLRGLDAAMERRQERAIGMSLKQQKEVERVLKWVSDQDGDALVRDHATAVLEGLETLQMKKLYKLHEEDSFRLGSSLGLEGNLQGLVVDPNRQRQHGEKTATIVEIE